MTKKKNQKNVLGETLEECSLDPLTGWYRDGCCILTKMIMEFIRMCKSKYRIFRMVQRSWQ